MANRFKIWVSLLCVGATLFLSGCNEEKEAAKAPLREVRTIVVESGSGIFERNFSGTLQSSNETSFSFRVSGTIEDIPVEVGQAVKKDEVIAIMDNSTYALEAQRARASLVEAQSQLRNVKADYERTKKLYEAGNSSRADLDNARAASEVATASTQAANKSLQIAQQNLSYTKLRSTADCQIASILGDAGENVSAGAEVITATCGEGLEVQLDIPESMISNIKKDMDVKINFSAIPDKTYQGIVKEVGVAAVSGGTTFPVDVLITDEDKTALKSGLSADVTFTIDNRNNGRAALPVLPSIAVGEDQKGRFVFALETQGDKAFVRRVPVTIGQIQQDGIEIASGVQPGMQVVTAGVSVLRDGMEVKAPQ
ncbi:MAG: efflux RND transporter periplasmic adaptor subunit [Alphaproteobacteria bacterium]